jgi:hypothetical protein
MMAAQEATGTIIGVQANCVRVQLDTGEEVLCRSVKRLHRPLGFFTVPYGWRARIRYSSHAGRMPLLVAVLND